MSNKTVFKQELTWRHLKTFFLEPIQWKEPYILNEEESHHLSRVLRVQKGEEVCVLDGQGRIGRFLVESFSKKNSTLSLIEEVFFPEPTIKTILAVAWTKAIRRSWIFEKAVEFGAWDLWLWKADHSQVDLHGEFKASWINQIVAGGKQCKNPWFPKVKLLSEGIYDIISYAEQANCRHRQIFVENTYGPVEIFKPSMLSQTGVTVCVIGPEGGFSVKEIDTLKEAGFLSLSFGERVLRWETAAMLCLGLHWWGNNLDDFS